MSERYRSTSQQTLLAIQGLLAKRGLAGVDVAQVTASVGCTRDQAFRGLHNLAAVGWVEQRGGRWYPARAMTRHAYRIVRAYADYHLLQFGGRQ